MPGLPPIVPGFPASNRVPGAYGVVNYGVGGQSAANLPKKLLAIGLKTAAGTIAADVQVQPILSPSDADNYAGIGSELACMLYDALLVAAALGVPLYAASPTPSGGATAATTNLKITGTATGTGQITVRVNGAPISLNVPIGMTGAQACTALAGLIAGFKSGRSRLTASAATNYCTISCNTPGVRGMQDVVFLDVSQPAPGLTATLYVVWTTGQTWVVGDQVIPSPANGFYYKCTTAGTGSGGPPSFPTTIGQTVADGTATFTCWGTTATGNLPTTALFLGNATGLETYTNLLQTLTSQRYDRWAVAANDAVSLAAIKTQIDQYAGAPYNFMQSVIVATNGSFAAAQSLYQTTLNDTRFNCLWELNAETHPSRITAQKCGIRCATEQSNPNPNYDGLILPFVAPQSQQADWPALPTLISAINNSVTPITSGPFGLGPGGDGYARVVRSITSKSLTNGFADYSTIDVGQQIVPDFVFEDLKLLYLSKLQPANPVISDDPPPQARKVKSGVLTPSMVTAAHMAKLTDYSNGVLTSTPLAGSATIAPIIQPPITGDVDAVFNPGAGNIIAADTVRVMQLDHQLGIVVNQSP